MQLAEMMHPHRYLHDKGSGGRRHRRLPVIPVSCLYRKLTIRRLVAAISSSQNALDSTPPTSKQVALK
jgi:hypothetical protein